MTALEIAKTWSIALVDDVKPGEYSIRADTKLLAQEVIRLTEEIEFSKKGLAHSRVADWQNEMEKNKK